jgi:hypothetical protein
MSGGRISEKGEKSFASGILFLLAKPEFRSHLASGYPQPCYPGNPRHSLHTNLLIGLSLYNLRVQVAPGLQSGASLVHPEHQSLFNAGGQLTRRVEACVPSENQTVNKYANTVKSVKTVTCL